jgi:hypothetical protein
MDDGSVDPLHRLLRHSPCRHRLATIASAPGRTQHTHLQDGALCQPWGPQFQAWSCSRCGELSPSLSQSRRFICLEVVLFGSAQEESNIRCRRRPPLQLDDDDDHYAPRAGASTGAATKTMSSSEHGQVRPGTKDCRIRSRSESNPI